MVDVVSLFSGCGGSDEGVTRAGFNVVFANDVLKYAKDVYLENHCDTEYLLGDVSSIKSFPKAELLIGCYPCQGFSQGGARDPSRRINTLYLEFARALNQIKPKAFIVENVSGLVRKNYHHLLKDQLRVFELAGYKVKADILTASDYGVAQDRKRIFIVGIRNDFDIDYTFPAPTHGTKNTLPKLSIRDVIGQFDSWPEGEFYDLEFHWYYMSRDRYRGWDQQSKTIVANPRHMPLHPSSPPMVKHGHNDWRFEYDGPARRYSYKEAAAIQGFKDLQFPETQNASLNMKYTVVGNAVPPPLFQAVAENLPDIWD